VLCLLKGVSKRIIEVNNSDNEYFERILFFIKPNTKEFSDEHILKEAKNFSKFQNKNEYYASLAIKKYRQRRKIIMAFKMSLLALCSSAVTALLFWLI
jgi:hypothetical protein